MDQYITLKDAAEKLVKPKKTLKILDLNSDERPYAVMIDNNVGYNAHAGLQDAYLTYEIIVEGGLTRLMAIFKDQDTELKNLSQLNLMKGLRS